MPKLSAVLITYNEEGRIGRTLEALAFADEIVVVDSASTDRTVEICRARGARVLTHAFEGFGPQKRFATAQASHDWVLNLDADEVVAPELGGAIRALLDAGEPPCAGYRLSFQLVFMGRPFRHGALAHRRVLRLFDRRRASWTDAAVHERLVVDGAVGDLPGTVLHFTTRNLEDSVAKLNAYSTFGALELRQRGKRCSAAHVLLLGPFHFIRHWVFLGNFMNGVPGLAWSILNATGSVMKRLKLHELEGRG